MNNIAPHIIGSLSLRYATIYAFEISEPNFDAARQLAKAQVVDSVEQSYAKFKTCLRQQTKLLAQANHGIPEILRVFNDIEKEADSHFQSKDQENIQNIIGKHLQRFRNALSTSCNSDMPDQTCSCPADDSAVTIKKKLGWLHDMYRICNDILNLYYDTIFF